MGKIEDLLRNGDGSGFRELWDKTEAAAEWGPIPAGTYECHLIDGKLRSSQRNETPGYSMTFKVCEGEYRGRQFWLDLWLTELAMPMSKRDLAKIGVTSLEQLEQPFPDVLFRCRVKLALQRDDQGNEHNRVQRFDVLAIDQPQLDAFAPTIEEKGESHE